MERLLVGPWEELGDDGAPLSVQHASGDPARIALVRRSIDGGRAVARVLRTTIQQMCTSICPTCGIAEVTGPNGPPVTLWAWTAIAGCVHGSTRGDEVTEEAACHAADAAIDAYMRARS